MSFQQINYQATQLLKFQERLNAKDNNLYIVNAKDNIPSIVDKSNQIICNQTQIALSNQQPQNVEINQKQNEAVVQQAAQVQHVINIKDQPKDPKKLKFWALVNLEITKSDSGLLKPELIRDGIDKKFKLLFRGSTHGFKAARFHQLCDNQGPTICFILSEFGEVFGGFTSVPWTSPSDYKYQSDPSAFVFSLTKKSIHKQYRYYNNAVWHYKERLCHFGYGYDIIISDDCDKNNGSYCNLGGTYEFHSGTQFETNEAQEHLGGQFKFKVLEIAVFQLI
eukprot:403349038